MNLELLDEPFAASDIEWRTQSCGKNASGAWAIVLAYVTNRAIMKRLDDVCGKANWRNEYSAAPNGGLLCGLSIRTDGEWVTKWDGADNTNMDAVKGGLSGAMKRAAVQWGIGRYLYDIESGFANASATKPQNATGWKQATTKSKDKIWYQIPKLPQWALPKQIAQQDKYQAPKPKASDPDKLLKRATTAMSSADMPTLEKIFIDAQRLLKGNSDHLTKLTDLKDIRKGELEIGDL